MDSGTGITGGGSGYFGARGRSSVRYGTRLGDLEENWFIQVNTQHTRVRSLSSVRYRDGTRLGDLKESRFILFSN